MQIIQKERILSYLQYSQDEVDILQLAQWLSARSNGLLKLEKRNHKTFDWIAQKDTF